MLVQLLHRQGSVARLLHRAPAGFAQASLVALQADRDGADIRNFAGTEAIDVGRASPALFGRAERKGGAARKQRQSESKGCSNMPRAERRERLCDHGGIPFGFRWRSRSARAKLPIREAISAKRDFSHSSRW